MLLWGVVSVGTVKHLFYGKLVEAPCLREVEQRAAAAAAAAEAKAKEEV
jgi:hypothetical protein